MLLSHHFDGCREHGAQLEPGAVNSRPHSIGRQFARGRDLFTAEPADLAEKKDVSIEVRQRCQGLLQRKRHLLLRVSRSFRRGAKVCLRSAATLAVVVERNVSSNLEQPAGQLVRQAQSEWPSG